MIHVGPANSRKINNKPTYKCILTHTLSIQPHCKFPTLKKEEGNRLDCNP